MKVGDVIVVGNKHAHDGSYDQYVGRHGKIKNIITTRLGNKFAFVNVDSLPPGDHVEIYIHSDDCLYEPDVKRDGIYKVGSVCSRFRHYNDIVGFAVQVKGFSEDGSTVRVTNLADGKPWYIEAIDCLPINTNRDASSLLRSKA